MDLSWTLHLGAALYATNLGVGTAAQLGVRFGAVHHWLYALVFAAAIAAAVFAFHPALIVTLVALAGLPFSKPGTLLHPSLAAVGALGYVGAYLFELYGTS